MGWVKIGGKKWSIFNGNLQQLGKTQTGYSIKSAKTLFFYNIPMCRFSQMFYRVWEYVDL